MNSLFIVAPRSTKQNFRQKVKWYLTTVGSVASMLRKGATFPTTPIRAFMKDMLSINSIQSAP
jgi:hypothetical protein